MSSDQSGARVRAARPLARIKTVLLMTAGMSVAAVVMYLVAHGQLRAVAARGRVGSSTEVIMLTILAIMVGFSALCAVGFYHVLFKPLSELNQVISRRARGDREARLRWQRSDEIGAIGRNFDAMVDAINDAEQRLREFAANSVRALAMAVDAKDPYTHHHSERVACYATAIADAIGLAPEHVAQIHTAGILHDVGKIAVPDRILLSPNRLTAEEFEVMKSHSETGERLVAGAGMPTIAHWIRHHHERFGGGGYPDGIAGAAISQEGRVLAVADSFEAMTSHRYYRRALDVEVAVEELERNAGTQFDPEIVAVFVRLVRSGELGPKRSESAAAAVAG